MKLSETQLAALLTAPNTCPNCNSESLGGDPPRLSEGDSFLCTITCLDCGQQWEEEYALTNVFNIQD